MSENGGTVALPRRKFGPKLEATVVGYGGGALSGPGGGYGFGDVSDAEAQSTLEAAFELGIRLFDTAPIYGFGVSESRLGDFFRRNSVARKDSVVVTKCGVDWDVNRKVSISNAPEIVKRMLGESLQRLKMSYVDVYMIHWPDNKTRIQDTMEAMARLQEEGLFTSIGVSNFTPEQIAEAETVAPIDVVQGPFSLVSASADGKLLPYCQESDKGFMSYATLAKGILSGTVHERRDFDSRDIRAQSDKILRQYRAVKSVAEEFFQIARSHSMTGSQLAVAWVLSRGAVSTALCGSKTLDQVREIVAASSLSLEADVLKRLDQLAQVATPLFDGVNEG